MKDRLSRKHRTGHRSHVSDKNRYAAGMKDKFVKQTKDLERSLKQERGNRSMLRELKNLNVDTREMEELIALSAFAKSMKAEYEFREMEVPEWIGDRLTLLNSEIRTRRHDELTRALREKKIRRQQMAPREERVAQLDADIERLEKQLAGG